MICLVGRKFIQIFISWNRESYLRVIIEIFEFEISVPCSSYIYVCVGFAAIAPFVFDSPGGGLNGRHGRVRPGMP